MNEQKDKLLINLVEPGRIGRCPFNSFFSFQLALPNGRADEKNRIDGPCGISGINQKQMKIDGIYWNQLSLRWLVTRPGCFLLFFHFFINHQSINPSFTKTKSCLLNGIEWNWWSWLKELKERRAAPNNFTSLPFFINNHQPTLHSQSKDICFWMELSWMILLIKEKKRSLLFALVELNNIITVNRLHRN